MVNNLLPPVKDRGIKIILDIVCPAVYPSVEELKHGGGSVTRRMEFL
jgi:hypothetical protein